MSQPVSESVVSKRAQEPRLIVDRYGDMDLVTINFILPKDVLKETRGRDIAVEIQALIAEKGLTNGHVSHYGPLNWKDVPGRADGPYAQ